jgi:ferrous iron transport protein A
MAMGLINGTEVEFKKRAPLGDPVQIKVRGYDLSFRNNDAKNIIVELC